MANALQFVYSLFERMFEWNLLINNNHNNNDDDVYWIFGVVEAKLTNNINLEKQSENGKLFLFRKITYIYFTLFSSASPHSQYAQETQHEKILRGLAVGIALTMYARLEEADPLVTSLSTDKDPVLRRSGMYTLGMAYCGTGSNKAIRKLLHIAVSRCICLDVDAVMVFTSNSTRNW